MKKILLTLPVFIFAFYYPLNFRFSFMHKCLQSSNLTYKYEYCECMYEKITNRFTYRYFSNATLSKEITDFLKKASVQCIKKTNSKNVIRNIH